MKISITFSLALLLVLAGLAHGEEESTPKKSSAWHAGFAQARFEFVAGNYKCLKSVIRNDFEPVVKDDVYKWCRQSFRFWDSQIRRCRLGARAFLKKKLDECADDTIVIDEDCSALVRGLVVGVVEEFCRLDDRTGSSASGEDVEFTRKCVKEMRRECYNQSVKKFGAYKRNGMCINLPRGLVTDDERDDISYQCNEDIDWMIENANAD